MPTLAGNEQPFHPSLPSQDAPFSIFRQKMDGLNLSEMDIKVFIPAPTFFITVLKNIFPEWEKEKGPLVGKKK